MIEDDVEKMLERFRKEDLAVDVEECGGYNLESMQLILIHFLHKTAEVRHIKMY